MAGALALSVALALGGCGGDGDDPPVPSSDDPPSGVAPGVDEPGAGQPTSPLAPVGTGTETEPGGPDEPDEPAAPVTSDPDGDDLPGLVVEGLDGQAAGEVVSPWLLNATFFRRDSQTPGSGDGAVDLVRYRDDFPVGAHADYFAKELDTCRLDRDVGDEGGDPDDPSPPLVSGGSSITINVPAGPWFVFDAEAVGEGGTETPYTTDNELPGPLPADATLSVPGDVFPNVAAFPLPDEPDVPVRLLPAEGERLGLDTAYTWLPGDGTDFIEMEFIASDAETGDFVDFPLVCLAVDDGRFTLPDDARTFLASTGDDIRLRYNRTRDVLTLADGIVFRTRLIVAE